MRNARLNSLLLTVAAGLLAASPSLAATVLLQDYEPPGNLDAPFNLAPDFSGTTTGVVAETDTITHIADDGAAGTTASAELFVEHNAAESPTSGGWQWQVRFLPNSGGSSNAANPLFASDGFVGYYLKVDSSVAADLLTAPALEGSTGTGTATTGDLKSVVKDGRWHLYQWNMDDPSQFDNTWDDVFGGGLGDTTLEAMVSFDAIAIVSPNGGNATVRIDQIGYNNEGAIPEPTSLLLAACGLLGLAFAGRRRAG